MLAQHSLTPRKSCTNCSRTIPYDFPVRYKREVIVQIAFRGLGESAHVAMTAPCIPRTERCRFGSLLFHWLDAVRLLSVALVCWDVRWGSIGGHVRPARTRMTFARHGWMHVEVMKWYDQHSVRCRIWNLPFPGKCSGVNEGFPQCQQNGNLLTVNLSRSRRLFYSDLRLLLAGNCPQSSQWSSCVSDSFFIYIWANRDYYLLFSY